MTITSPARKTSNICRGTCFPSPIITSSAIRAITSSNNPIFDASGILFHIFSYSSSLCTNILFIPANVPFCHPILSYKKAVHLHLCKYTAFLFYYNSMLLSATSANSFCISSFGALVQRLTITIQIKLKKNPTRRE